MPSFVFFTLNPGEGLCLGWKRGGDSPSEAQGLCQQWVSAVSVQEGPSQEKGPVHLRLVHLFTLASWRATDLCGAIGRTAFCSGQD